MRISFKNLRMYWHRLIGSKKVKRDGVWVSTDRNDIPKSLQSMLFKNVYEDQERDIIKTILKPDSIVLEIGTGIGLISLITRNICKEGRVLSYEANPNMERVIRKNYSLNNLEPELVMKAVTIDGGSVEFYIDEAVLGSSTIDRNRNDTKVSLSSDCIDNILQDLQPDTIIMDVEGAEISLLGQSELTGVKNIIVELHPHIVGEAAITELMENISKKGFSQTLRNRKVSLLQR